MITDLASAASAVSIRGVVDAVEDPELAGVTIGDLGMVLDVRVEEGIQTHGRPDSDGAHVVVDLAPTFLGCVAVGLICLDIQHRVLAIDSSIGSCDVRVVHSTWSTDRITQTGVARLRELGIVVLRPGDELETTACPYCAHTSLSARGGSGPTRCRSVAWCDNCRTVVEAMSPKSAPVRAA